MSALFAATHPERVSHLILIGCFGRAADRSTDDVLQSRLEQILKNWGTGETIKTVAPSESAKPGAIELFSKFERLSSSPGAFRTIMQLNRKIDVTSILPTLQVPTLVLHSKTDIQVPVELGPKARCSNPDREMDRIRDRRSLFLARRYRSHAWRHRGVRHRASRPARPPSSTVFSQPCYLLTLSTLPATPLQWATIGGAAKLDDHDQLAQQIVGRHRGNLVKNTGDGLLATFDGPGRAVRCALAFGSAAREIGLPVRAGLHTGEIEIRGSDIGGIAVHAAARVMSHCGSDEVLVSRVVTDLVAGAGLKFAERGSFELKGLPGRWDLFAASG